jgi:PIN domain nuclease of toxin-antitoxin system
MDALNMIQLRIVPLTPSIAYKSTTLKESPFTDPADQIIIATAIEEDAVLITKDVLMGKYKHVKTLWAD